MTNPKTPQTPDTELRKPLEFPGHHPPDEDPVGAGASSADELVDRESEDSFPASDPPSNTPLTAGEPDKAPVPTRTPADP